MKTKIKLKDKNVVADMLTMVHLSIKRGGFILTHVAEIFHMDGAMLGTYLKKSGLIRNDGPPNAAAVWIWTPNSPPTEFHVNHFIDVVSNRMEANSNEPIDNQEIFNMLSTCAELLTEISQRV